MLLIAAAVATLLATTAAPAQTPTARTVIANLDTPWEILWGPDGWIWVTERRGAVSRVNPTTGQRLELLRIGDVYQSGESGLLGMALHPDFADTPHVFLVYTYRENNAILEKLVRYSYDGTTLASPVTLLSGIPGNTTHDGSRIIITPDRKLFMTVGDAQNQPAAQSHLAINGKILRMNLDGGAPADNPWAAGAAPEKLLWSTGHRNPQGLVLAPNGILYSSEHGPNNDDEINIIRKGRNFGWPTVQGFCDTQSEKSFCADSSVVEPLTAWTPTIATCGLDYYDHPSAPAWRNSLLLTNLKGSSLMRLSLSPGGDSITSIATFLQGTYGRLRDLCVSPAGRIYIATSNRDGRGSPKADDDKIIELSFPSAGPDLVSASVDRSEYRPGDTIRISYTTTGTFPSLNSFLAELSSVTGSFANPRVLAPIGLPPGEITSIIPCDAVPGNGYYVRVRSTAPPDTAIAFLQVIVLAPAPVAITPSDSAAYCEGDSVTLTAPAGYRSYRWTMEGSQDRPTTRTIRVGVGGNVTVEVTDELGCTRRSAPVMISQRDRPTPHILTSGDNGNRLDAGAGYVAYRWSTGETTRMIVPAAAGEYWVEVTDSAGCTGISPRFSFTPSAVPPLAGDASAAGVRLRPSPATSRLEVEIDLRAPAPLSGIVTDTRGAVVRRIAVAAPLQHHRLTLNTEDLPPGVYLLRIESTEGSWSGSFVRE